MSSSRAFHTATLLGNGKILIAGGAKIQSSASRGKVHTTTTPLATAELFDSQTGAFSPTVSLTTPRAWHTATLLGNGEVLLTGGVDAPGNVLATAELYQSGKK